MGHPSNPSLRTAGIVRPPAGIEALDAKTSGFRRRRVIGAVSGILLIGALAAGCGGAGTATGGSASRNELTSTRHEASASTTTSTTAVQPCGSNRDPFDPTASPPPAGSAAIC